MLVYWAYVALVVCFVLVIVLHAWFVRRLTADRDRLRAASEEHGRLQAAVAELAEAVGELSRGKDSNAVSIRALTQELEEVKEKIRVFLADHPELAAEFGSQPPGAVVTHPDTVPGGAAAPASDGAA